jgi:hypothetical protein
MMAFVLIRLFSARLVDWWSASAPCVSLHLRQPHREFGDIRLEEPGCDWG